MTLKQWLSTQPGLSVSELARRIGMSQPYTTRLVNGLRKPSLDTARRIESVTGGKVRLESWFADGRRA